MHNKFCIIDLEVVINGSYNWTKKAKSNHESITVTSDSSDIALDFFEEFKNIKDQYFKSVNSNNILDINNVIIRLETLKNLILLEDFGDVDHQLIRLKKVIHHSKDSDACNEIIDIIEQVEIKRFAEAVARINTFIDKNRQLTVYIDSELFALKLEIKGLEINISSLEDEKTEMEKLLYEFEVRYNRVLGKLLMKLLKLRRDFFYIKYSEDKSWQNNYEESEADYKRYKGEYKSSKTKQVRNLTKEQQNDLKTKYRYASKLCHPDIVADEFKADAEKVFVDLKTAYEQGNIEVISEITSELEKGVFASASKIISEKEKYLTLKSKLRGKRDRLEEEIIKLKRNNTFQILVRIEDWGKYFDEKGKQLQQEINGYEQKIAGIT